MNLTQDEIDALMRSSESLSLGEGAPSSRRTPAKARTSTAASPWSYLLELSVPLVVRVAERDMKLNQILEFCVGSIVEFDTPAEAELDLLVNNCLVAKGMAVKVGENFGLRLTRLLPPPS